MVSLAALLAQAARSTDWEHAVVHRCAWCEHIEAVDRMRVVVNDGMCATCARRALVQLAQRRAA